MFFDLNLNAAPKLKQKYDYCIVGSGAAGITLALELEQRGWAVALMEGGGSEYTEESQECYRGQTVGDNYFDLTEARLRYFGGSTNHWGGTCRPLDEHDFKRPKLGQLFDWPIRKTDLDPYLSHACEILEIDPWFKDHQNSEIRELNEIELKESPPVVFSYKYEERIQKSERIDLVLNATLVDLRWELAKIVQAQFSNFQGQSHLIKADKFIFAMGGIENSRILLHLQNKHGTLCPIQNKNVGKYWMEHVYYTVGDVIINRKFLKQKFFTLNSETQSKLGLLNSRLSLEEVTYDDTMEFVRSLMCVAPSIASTFSRLVEKNIYCGARLLLCCEQPPVETNRITLSKKNKDQFQIPLAELRWTKHQSETTSCLETATFFGQAISSANVGRLRLADWIVDGIKYTPGYVPCGYHHMGGTRMAKSDRHGVVDLNCKVFGTENLYIAGSSVFPTGGFANPTLTIVQLALRLANHLSRV